MWHKNDSSINLFACIYGISQRFIEPCALNSEQSLADILESFQFTVAKTRHYNIGREDIIMFTDNYN
jgi:hypothetical protein